MSSSPHKGCQPIKAHTLAKPYDCEWLEDDSWVCGNHATHQVVYLDDGPLLCCEHYDLWNPTRSGKVLDDDESAPDVLPVIDDELCACVAVLTVERPVCPDCDEWEDELYKLRKTHHMLQGQAGETIMGHERTIRELQDKLAKEAMVGAALRKIANMPTDPRPDGTHNYSREALIQIAKKALQLTEGTINEREGADE